MFINQHSSFRGYGEGKPVLAFKITALPTAKPQSESVMQESDGVGKLVRED